MDFHEAYGEDVTKNERKKNRNNICSWDWGKARGCFGDSWLPTAHLSPLLPPLFPSWDNTTHSDIRRGLLRTEDGDLAGVFALLACFCCSQVSWAHKSLVLICEAHMWDKGQTVWLKMEGGGEGGEMRRSGMLAGLSHHCIRSLLRERVKIKQRTVFQAFWPWIWGCASFLGCHAINSTVHDVTSREQPESVAWLEF